MRILGVARISRTDAASTSIDRQRESIERWATAQGHTITAWAVDEDVSGDVAPWARPELGQYLPRTLANRDATAVEVRRALAASRADEWDMLAVWHLDRLSRRAADLLAVIDWCRAAGRPVFDMSGVDYTGPAGAITVAVLGGLAQGERDRMVERARSSFEKLSRMGRWRGGPVPWGYRVAVGDDGRKMLAVDDEAAALIRSIAERVKVGESINAIAADLNRRGVRTPSGRGEWRMGSLQRAIKSERLLGYMVREETKDGVRREWVVRGDDGLPVQRAEPILSRADLSAIRARLAENRNGAGRRPGVRPDRAMLLRVLWCGECGGDEPMYRAMGRNHAIYRCGWRARTGSNDCRNVAVPAAAADALISEHILSRWGDEPVIERVWEAGSDIADRVAEVTEALRLLRDDRAAGLYSTATGEAEYREMYARLEERREHLQALPQIPSGWREVSTGETLRDRWAAAEDDAARNAILRASGIRFRVDRGTGRRGQDIASRLSVLLPLAQADAELLADLDEPGSVTASIPAGVIARAGEVVGSRLTEPL